MAEASTSQPVIVLGSVAAASVVLATGLPPLLPDQLDWIGPAVGLLGLVATAVLTVLTRAKVVLVENVAARLLPSGTTVAGDASDVVNGAPVDVTPATPSNWAP